MKEGTAAAAGPPCTIVTSGIFSLARTGNNSQPCTLNSSLFHERLCTRAAGAMPALAAVKFRQPPTGPTSISGAAV
jgi:hypothetical protein